MTPMITVFATCDWTFWVWVRNIGMCLALVLTPRLVSQAGACSCGGPNPPCAAFWEADAVFVGKTIDIGPERLGGFLDWNVHKIAVSQVLRGNVDVFVTMVPAARPSPDQIAAATPGAAFGTSCDY